MISRQAQTLDIQNPHGHIGEAARPIPLLLAIHYPVPGCGQATARPFRSVSRADGADLFNAPTAKSGRRPSVPHRRPVRLPNPDAHTRCLDIPLMLPGSLLLQNEAFHDNDTFHARIAGPSCSRPRRSKNVLTPPPLSSSTFINTGRSWSQTARKRYRPHWLPRGENGLEHFQLQRPLSSV